MITLEEGFASDVDVSTMVGQLPLKQHTIPMYGRLVPVPRLMSWHGDGSYTYGRKTYEADSFPPLLHDLLRRVNAHVGCQFNSCLANWYRDGQDSVSWHSDDEPEMGSVIASISLGGGRDFKIRPKGKPAHKSDCYTLRHGSLLVMRGTLQQTHEHCVPKTRKPVMPRLNLTFRVLAT